MASYDQARSLLNNSVARPTLYSLEITGKNILSNVTGVTGISAAQTEYMKLFCNNIEFPGLDYEQVTSIGQEDMGIQRSTPSGLLFGAGNRLRFSVIENSDFTVYNSLRTMFNSACAQGGNPGGSFRAQRMRYYNDVVFNVTLRKLEFSNKHTDIPQERNISKSALDHGYKVVATYLFEHCFISSIGPVTYDSSQTDTFMTFVSTLKFENYYHDDTPFMYGRDTPIQIRR